jgi:hypothetical protein
MLQLLNHAPKDCTAPRSIIRPRGREAVRMTWDGVSEQLDEE